MSVNAADRVTGQWGGAGKETVVTNPQRLHLLDFVRFRESRVPDVSQLICKRGKGPTSRLIPFTPRVPLWRCEVFDSQVYRKLSVVLAGVAVLTLAGCSNKASNEAATAAKKPEAAKPAAAAKAPQPTAMVTLPKGTAISATVGQTLATNKNKER